ncbi:adenine nucleotide alpha hydrolase [Kaistia algarum]|uniref:adenine nucleotide alpha hydrolase n=1 Tax=Kaistia algarum TaxID=2083279 RepID=UPI000CE7427C|nr:adenine nucleotide alpha hydrolase [Kaistia algarum]MCX5514388.1 adenine nucleotide alpha hydrolase [Kaistia algarum]PPE79247.1 adenine nucleotide alpha hydrolase [Kaistia algarum]
MPTPLEEVLSSLGPITIAVSGGVDSMTLAIVAGRLLGTHAVDMAHAVSPAVQPEATERVRLWAQREGWTLVTLDAGEFGDRNYLDNPVNRCFFCKGHLYGAIAGLSRRQIVSGANMDDLGEYRPGLDAARAVGVRHPYVEAGVDKAGVRNLARQLGLGDLAELPASPCLSSRVETAIRIDPATLTAIHAIETLVGRSLAPETVRCRVRHAGVVIELDPSSLAAAEGSQELVQAIAALLPASIAGQRISFEAYRKGSAFVGAKS